MMRRLLRPIPDAVLLSRHSEVHRDQGGRTWCGRTAPAGRVASVSDIQAMVYRLALCAICYPDPHTHTLGREGGERHG